MERVRGYHFGNSRGSRERRGAPGSGVWYLGLGVAVSFSGVSDAGGTQTPLWKGASSFYYFQLLPAAAAFEDRARAGRLCKRTLEDSRRNGISSERVCGDAGACASADQRAEAGDAFDGASETETARGAKVGEAEKAAVRDAVAIAVRGDGRPFARVLAGAVLRFQCVHQWEEEGKVELHACEAGEAGFGGTPEGLEVEQLEFLLRRRCGDGEDRCAEVRRDNYPERRRQEKENQPQDPGTKHRNPGHPPQEIRGVSEEDGVNPPPSGRLRKRGGSVD